MEFSIWKTFSLFDFFGYKFVDLLVFSFYKAKCALPKNRVCLRSFTCPTAPDQRRGRSLSRPACRCNDLQNNFNSFILVLD